MKFPEFPVRACLPIFAGAALLSHVTQAATIVSVGTTGVFDENVDATNALDVAAPAGSLPTFKASVLDAYNNNLGGVVDWETGVAATASAGSSANNLLSTINVAYGASASNVLTVAFDRDMELYTNDIAGQVSVLSRQGSFHNAILPDGVAASSVLYTMSFSGAQVTEVGAAMPSRSTYGGSGVDFSVTANFSGGGDSTIIRTIGGNAGTTDTFFYFGAPGGENITSLSVTFLDDNGQGLTNGQRRPILDDFGFVVVPEPSTTAAFGLALLSTLLIRRRR